jgi:hypothetical protein
VNLNRIISELRQHCPVFAQRVGGAAEFSPLTQAANLTVPAAYVIPLDDEVGPAASGQGYRQLLTEGVSIVVALDNKADERGQTSIAALEQIRAELWHALLAWSPGPEYGPFIYDGGHLLSIDRARLFFAFDFSAQTEIVTSDTRQAVEIGQLEPLLGADVQVDAIDPAADPNRPQRYFPTDSTAYPGGNPGPDGRIEHQAEINLSS